jgi:hypothetical protein
MKNILLAITAFILFSVTPYAQNVGIGTTTPQAYGHGGTNRLLELRNDAGTGADIQSHLILSTNGTTGSLGTLTWAAPNITGAEKRTALIANLFETANATRLGFFTRTEEGSILEKFSIIGNGNIGIGNTTPGFPLNFASSLGDKISLYGNSGNHYGIGIQTGLLQIYSNAAAANIAFGYGNSSSFSERMRITNSGIDGMVLSGRLLLKNGTGLLTDGPGVWMYKADNSGLLAFIGTQNNQNIGFYGGPSGWGFTYDAINSRVGIGTTTPTSLLNVNGQLTIDQKNIGGYGGLLIKGNIPGSNYPNIGFTIKNNAATTADVVAGMIQGDLVNNAVGSESIDLNFLTSQTGLGGLTERLRIKSNGAIAVNGNTGTTKQILMSNGSSSSPAWTNAGNIIQTIYSGQADLTVTGANLVVLTNCNLVVNITEPARIITFYKAGSWKDCLIGACDTKWELQVYLDGNFFMKYRINWTEYAGEKSSFQNITYGVTLGPDFMDVDPGVHTISFKAMNKFNEPRLFFQASAFLIPR